MADDTLQLECGNGKHIAWFDATHCRCGAVTLQDADHAIAAPVADDTPTVEQATKALGVAVLEYAVATAELPLREREPFAAAVGVARDALIAAVRAETLAEYTLTDTEVDKFLEACEKPQDPARVERIRKLFNEKLKLGQEWVTKVTNDPDSE